MRRFFELPFRAIMTVINKNTMIDMTSGKVESLLKGHDRNTVAIYRNTLAKPGFKGLICDDVSLKVRMEGQKIVKLSR